MAVFIFKICVLRLLPTCMPSAFKHVLIVCFLVIVFFVGDQVTSSVQNSYDMVGKLEVFSLFGKKWLTVSSQGI